MSRLTLALLVVFGLWLAGGMQQALAPRLSILGCPPDFLLVVLAVAAMYLDRRRAALFGFACGLVQGGLAGANLTHYIISRTGGGFVVSWFQNPRLEPNMVVAFGTGFSLTVFSQVLLMFLAPPRELGPFLGATIGSAAYNGVLVLPVYFLAKALIGPPRT